MANYHEACSIVITPFLAEGPNLKFAQFFKHGILDEITKFNAHQIFPLYCNHNVTECFIVYICIGGSKQQQHDSENTAQFSGTE